MVTKISNTYNLTAPVDNSLLRSSIKKSAIRSSLVATLFYLAAATEAVFYHVDKLNIQNTTSTDAVIGFGSAVVIGVGMAFTADAVEHWRKYYRECLRK